MKTKIITLGFLFTFILYANETPKYPASFSDESVRNAKVKQLLEKDQKEKAEAEAWAHANNKRIRYEVDGTLHELMRIENGIPIYYITYNYNAAISTAADLIRNTSPYNLNGSNVTVGVWDGGSVLSTHQEFDGRVTVKDGAASHYHSTHVGGTIGAKGVVASAKGMAPSVKIDSYEWTSDEAEMASRAASAPNQSTKIYISNHSYGTASGWVWANWSGVEAWHWYRNISTMYDYSFGRYSSYARDWDVIAYNAPYYLIMKSSGNDRNDTPSNGNTIYYYNSGWHPVAYNSASHPKGDGVYYNNGYDCITSKGVAKNILTVGAVNDAVSSGVRWLPPSMASFSSWGPADDGRIKPDVVGNGVNLYSCDNGYNSDYTTLSGTSMSSPNVCGSAALLVQHYRNLNSSDMRSSTLKGIIIHTADDIGNPGPDYAYGWGLMNTKVAADVISKGTVLSDMSAQITEGLLDNANSDDEYSFTIDGSEPFKVTICWTDPQGAWTSTHNNRTPVLINDLDLRIVSPNGTTNYPFVLDVNNPSANATTGDNIVDNVEQIIINTGATPGAYTVEITHKGFQPYEPDYQHYSLIVSGAIPEPSYLLFITGNFFFLFLRKNKNKFRIGR